MEGYLKEKNWLTPGRMMAQMRPTTQARKVDEGIVGSSVLATADRTSTYGDSSSTTKAKKSIFGSSSSMTGKSESCVYPVSYIHPSHGRTQREEITDIDIGRVLWGVLLDVDMPRLVFKRHGITS
jgi:hypothetical protein